MRQMPLFLFSLPRAGSTLVQRVLAKHPSISTQTEPWLLLPLLYALKKEGVMAEYGHIGVYAGIEDFIATLPNKEGDYLKAVADFAISLYSQSSDQNETYFLDKTPRNSLVSQEILDAFKEQGKFVFLWRNPLAIAASMIETFGGGKWNLYRFEIDLYKGLDCLLASAKQCSQNQDDVLRIRYEDFVQEPEESLNSVYSFLGLEALEEVSVSLAENDLKGRLGDPTGVKSYNKISTQSLNKWVIAFQSPLRKRWAEKYLHHIGKENLAYMGYDLDTLLEELNAIETSYTTVLSDVVRMIYGKLYSRVNLPALRASLWGKKRWKYPLY